MNSTEQFSGLNDQLTLQKEELMSKIGKDNWEKLLYSTRKDVSTALWCNYFFEQITGAAKKAIDYSAVIMPLMKSLEYELKNCFYKNYLTFLKNTYTPDQYIKINHIDKGTTSDWEICCRRPKIIDSNLYEQSYQIDYIIPQEDDEFYLSNLSRTLGVYNRAYSIDATAISYGKTLIVSEVSVLDKDIMEWLQNIAYHVDQLVGLRNDSAHGGKIMKREDAAIVLSELITTEKLLLKIANPSFAIKK